MPRWFHGFSWEALASTYVKHYTPTSYTPSIYETFMWPHPLTHHSLGLIYDLPSWNHGKPPAYFGRFSVAVGVSSCSMEFKYTPWKINMEPQITNFERNMIFQTSMIMFHVNLQFQVMLLLYIYLYIYISSAPQVLDYVAPGKFHQLARLCSIEGDTIHYGYSMNWIVSRLMERSLVIELPGVKSEKVGWTSTLVPWCSSLQESEYWKNSVCWILNIQYQLQWFCLSLYV